MGESSEVIKQKRQLAKKALVDINKLIKKHGFEAVNYAWNNAIIQKRKLQEIQRKRQELDEREQETLREMNKLQ